MKKTSDESETLSPATLLRIKQEREKMALRPWQFAPSEVDDGPNPCKPGTMGHASWPEAQKWRAELRAADPHYFDE